ncbi:MAG TPA: hypothetical protein VMS22_02205 [Candidatus Eisenbacteria bacterium]|nr:hypothetical protein [Candidatus Eisenbacteria bacterium]
MDRGSDVARPASPGSTERHATAGADADVLSPAIFAALLQQNWENVRSIKNQRISFLNSFALIGAGTQTLALSIRGELVLEIGLNLFMCALAVMGLLISLRLKAELEECLDKLHTLVVQAHVEHLMALELPEGELSRYPKFRWMFPVFYALAILLFVGLLAQRVTGLVSGP